jgi:O-antigen/teichoic acid export membrane protein
MLKFEKSRADYTSALQGLGTVITIALFVVYLVFKNKFNLVFKLPAILVLLMFAQCLFYPAFDFWSARQCFEYRYRLLIAVTVFIAIASPAIAIICIQRTIYKSEALVVGTVGVHLLLCIFFYVYNFSKCNKLFNKMYWRYALKFNLPLIPHYLAGMVLGQSDRVMIDWLVNRSQAGIYSLAYSISLVMNVVIGGVNASFIFHVPGLKPPPLGGQL